MLGAGGKNLRAPLNFAAGAVLNSDANCFEPARARSPALFRISHNWYCVGLIGFDGGRIRRKSSAPRANYPALWGEHQAVDLKDGSARGRKSSLWARATAILGINLIRRWARSIFWRESSDEWNFARQMITPGISSACCHKFWARHPERCARACIAILQSNQI